MGQFPLLTLQDILFSKSFVDKKVQIYIKECQKHNIIWIEGIISEMFRIFTSLKIDIKAKIHSMILLKQMVKTCQYAVLFLIQSYLLNFLTDIVEYFSKNPQFQKNSKYFQSLGYASSYPNIEQLSHNYVIIAWEILYMCGKIRPKQTFQSQQLQKGSSFHINLLKIKDKNYKIFNESELQKKLSISSYRQKYKQQLTQFENHSYFYVDNYMKKLEDYIFSPLQTKIGEVIDFKILLKKGDVYLTSETIARIAQMVDFVDDFRIKDKALSFLNQLILWGDVEAVITVNYTQYFEKIFRQFFKIDGSKGLKKGEDIFSEIKGQFEQKRKFYTDFLRCIQIWAETFPNEHMIFYDKEQNSMASPIFKNYRFLKQVRKFIFPENPFLDKMKIDIRQNFKNNFQRNNKIIQDLDKQVNEIEDKYKVSFEQVKDNVQLAQKNLQKLKNKNTQENINGLMNFLIKFENNFELQLQRLNENIDETTLDKIIQKGLIYVEIISQIQPEYDKYKKGKITLKDFISFCMKRIDLTGQTIHNTSLNSSRSILDRKSQLKSNISSRVNKSASSLRGMTEQTRLRIIKNKYLQRLQKIANRTNSQKDDSFLNTSLFLNTKRTNQSLGKLPLESLGKLPLESHKQINHGKVQNIRQVKSNQKYQVNVLKSPRQNGKKVFLVSKYIEKNNSQNLDNLKNKIIEQNWNSSIKLNNQIYKLKDPSLVQKNIQFSFVDQINSSNLKQHESKINSGQKLKQNSPTKIKPKGFQDFIKVIDQNQQSKDPQSDMFKSPDFGNTQIKDVTSNESRKRFRKGVGLAKQFVNLTQKLIGPKKHIVTFSEFEQYFPYNKSTQKKKQVLSKQMTILSNDFIQVDRLTISKDQKLTITYYLFPKGQCSRIRFKVVQTPSIYLNVSQNNDIRIQKSYYELKKIKQGEQYSFEIVGSVLKTPIIMPKLQIRVNQDQPLNFIIPFPLIHMITFKKPQNKWLGKQFDLADKIISEQFVRNKDIISSLSDVDDYLLYLTQIKADKTAKKYRTQGKLDKTSFIIEVRQVQNKMSVQACLLNQDCEKQMVQFLIAECMNLFS